MSEEQPVIEAQIIAPSQLLAVAVRERLDLCRFVDAQLWLTDDKGEPLYLVSVRVPRYLLDGTCREVLRALWGELRQAEDPGQLASAREEWQRSNGNALPWPEMPRVKRAEAMQQARIEEGSAAS